MFARTRNGRDYDCALWVTSGCGCGQQLVGQDFGECLLQCDHLREEKDESLISHVHKAVLKRDSLYNPDSMR